MSDGLTEAQHNLIAEITAAFDGVPRGSGMTLQHSAWCGRWVYCGRDEKSEEAQAERRKAHASATESCWQELTDETIESNDCLSYLDEDGFCYYIPAFMCWTVRHYPADWRTSRVETTTRHSLRLSRKYPVTNDHDLKRWRKFNVAQNKAVFDFLNYLLKLAEQIGDAREGIHLRRAEIHLRYALGSYWQQFENAEPE